MKYLLSAILLIIAVDFLGCGKNNNVSSTNANHPPVISSITATPDSVGPGESSLLKCNATDQDNDSLKYIWSYTSGNISGVGSQVTWTSPSSLGNYLISCIVEDGKGGQDMDSLSIPVVQKIPTQGLMAYYPFNGNANDESGNGNNGFVNGATLAYDRFNRPDKAFSFDGTDYIQINHSANFDDIENKDIISLSIWINVADWYYFSPGNPVFPLIDQYESSNDFGWEFLIWNGYFQFYASQSDNIACFYGFSLNVWYHLVCLYNRNLGTFKVYVNNQQICSKSFNADITNTITDPFYIGFSRTGDDEYAIGLIDDIRIYNRSLTDNEIAALYHENGWGN